MSDNTSPTHQATALDVMPELARQEEIPPIPQGYGRHIDENTWSQMDPNLRSMIVEREGRAAANRQEQLERIEQKYKSESEALAKRLEYLESAQRSPNAPQQSQESSDDPWSKLGSSELASLVARGIDAIGSQDEDVQVQGAQLARAIQELISRQTSKALSEKDNEWNARFESGQKHNDWVRSMERRYGADAMNQGSELWQAANAEYKRLAERHGEGQHIADMAFELADAKLKAENRDRGDRATDRRDLEVMSVADSSLRARNAITSAARRGDVKTAAKADLTNFFMGQEPVMKPRASLDQRPW